MIPVYPELVEKSVPREHMALTENLVSRGRPVRLAKLDRRERGAHGASREHREHAENSDCKVQLEQPVTTEILDSQDHPVFLDQLAHPEIP